MRLELNDGELLDLAENEARTLYETLLERARQRGARSAASKLRPVLAWPSEIGTTIVFDQFETKAVLEAVRENS